MGSDKKAFNVRGVQLGKSRSMDQVAAELETKMNALRDNGYSVQVLQVDEGLLVLGRLGQEDQEDPIERLFSALTQSPPDRDGLTSRVAGLFASVKSKISGDWVASFENEMPKVLPSVLKNAPLAVITEVAQECEDCATKHEKNHDRENVECPIPRFLRAMAVHMREYAQKNVQ